MITWMKKETLQTRNKTSRRHGTVHLSKSFLALGLVMFFHGWDQGMFWSLHWSTGVCCCIATSHVAQKDRNHKDTDSILTDSAYVGRYITTFSAHVCLLSMLLNQFFPVLVKNHHRWTDLFFKFWYFYHLFPKCKEKQGDGNPAFVSPSLSRWRHSVA